MLIFLGVLAYLFNNKDVISAWLIGIGMFCFSLIICLLNVSKWNVEMLPLTVIVIFSAFIFWGIGDIIAKSIYKVLNHPSMKSIKTAEIKALDIRKSITLLFSLVMVIVLFYYFRYIYQISLIAGNTGGYNDMFKYARYAVINTKYNIDMPFILSHLLLISKCTAYIYIFVLVYNKFYFNFVDFFVFVPIGIYVAQISISTARIDFIRLTTYILMLVFILWKKNNSWSNRLDWKIVSYGISGIIIFLLIFRLLGFLTTKTDSREIWDDISIYMGSSIVGLNQYLDSFHSTNDFFGKETLYNIYKILRKINLVSIPEYNTPLEFLYFNGSRTNIYTSFRRYIQDYNYIGLYFILFFQGFFYSYWIEKIKRRKVSGLYIILLCSIFYPVVEISLDEQFISNIFSLTTFYQSIYLIMLYYLLIGKDRYFSTETADFYELRGKDY